MFFDLNVSAHHSTQEIRRTAMLLAERMSSKSCSRTYVSRLQRDSSELYLPAV